MNVAQLIAYLERFSPDANILLQVQGYNVALENVAAALPGALTLETAALRTENVHQVVILSNASVDVDARFWVDEALLLSL